MKTLKKILKILLLIICAGGFAFGIYLGWGQIMNNPSFPWNYTATVENTNTPSPTSTQIPANTEMVNNIPEPVFDYGCIEKNGTLCIKSSDTSAVIIEHVLWAEGGGISNQMAVNVLQIAHNRMYYAWTCSINNCSNQGWINLNPDHIPWGSIDSKTFEKLALYIMSQPYYTADGIKYSSFNGWHVPVDMPAIERIPLLKRMYDSQYDMVLVWLELGVGADVEKTNISLVYADNTGKVLHIYEPYTTLRKSSVQYFYSTIDYLPDFDIIECDSIDYKDHVIYQCYTAEGGYNDQ
jgi:hypothetical protein